MSSTDTHGFKVYTDAMESRIPCGSTVIVDPALEPEPGAFVVVATSEQAEPILRQLVYEGPYTYLRAINPQYPTITADRPVVYGVAVQVHTDLIPESPS